MQNVIEKLNDGQIGVLPTDTIYGICCLALNKASVEKLFEIRERDPKKPFIIIISSIKDLELFNIKIDQKTKEILEKIWPNKVSIVLECRDKNFDYLSRGTKSLAFRLPNKENLLEILNKTGPLIATSVNPPGLLPAKNIKEAKDYFGDKLDFYIDEGEIESKPSTLIKIENGKTEVLRQGEIVLFLGDLF